MNLQNAMNPSRIRLWLETTFWRHGLLPFAALLFVVLGALAWLLWVPRTLATISEQKQRLTALETQSRNGGLHVARAVPPLVLFEQTLADPAAVNKVIRRIFELARDNGVTITQADYRNVSDRPNNQNAQNSQTTQIALSQFQIALPVKGGYAALKRFCLSLLSEVPAISIDQLTFKREQANSNLVNAQLLLTLWEHDSPGGNPVRSQLAPMAKGGTP